MMASEIDCSSTGRAVLEEYVEIKTHGLGDVPSWKMLKIWAQSYLAGVPRVIVGHRDESGFVRRITELAVTRIPKMAGIHWDPCLCLTFLHSLFVWLIDVTSREIDGTTFRMSFGEPFDTIKLKRGGSKVLTAEYLSFLSSFKESH